MSPSRGGPAGQRAREGRRSAQGASPDTVHPRAGNKPCQELPPRPAWGHMRLEAFVPTAIFGCVQGSVPSSGNAAVPPVDAALKGTHPLWMGVLAGAGCGGHPSGPHGARGCSWCWCWCPGERRARAGAPLWGGPLSSHMPWARRVWGQGGPLSGEVFWQTRGWDEHVWMERPRWR